MFLGLVLVIAALLRRLFPIRRTARRVSFWAQGALAFLLVMTAPCRADTAAAIELFNAKKYAEAQAAFEDLIAANSSDSIAHLYLGRLAQRDHKLDLAVSYFERAVKIAPENAECLFEYGAASASFANQNGLSLKALSLARNGRIGLERAVQLAPQNVEYKLALAEFYMKAPALAGGSLPKAEEQAEEAKKLDRKRSLPFLAELKLRENNYDEALAICEELVQAEPDSYSSLYRLGATAAMAGKKVDRGIEVLNKCLTLPPRGAPGLNMVHFRLGELYEVKNDLIAARASYRAALELDPTNRQAAEALAKLPGTPP